MKKIYYFILVLFASFSMTSCLNDDNYETYEDWRVENENYFSKMIDTLDANGDKYYTELKSLAFPSYKILYHELEAGNEDGRVPFYTSTVMTDYAGHLYNTNVNFDEGTNVVFKVNEVIPGWTLALQNMKEGAKWRIVIPWELAYGSTGNTSILPFSTLVFDVKLVKITKWETGTNTSTE